MLQTYSNSQIVVIGRSAYTGWCRKNCTVSHWDSKMVPL